MSKLELLDLPTNILSRIVVCVRDAPQDFCAEDLGYDLPVPNAARHDPWNSPVTSHTRHCRMKRDLFNIIATCRTLRAVAEPLLHFRLQSMKPALLLRTFLERPDLARQVRCLDLCDTSVEPSDLERLDHQAVDDAAARMSITLPPEWWNEAEQDSEEENYAMHTVFGMMLAFVAENLEALFIEVPFRGFPADLFADSSDIVFTNLRRVYLDHWDTEMSFDLTQAEQLFIRAPNLEHLWLNMCGGVDSFLDLDNVRSLRMTNSIFDHAALSLLVRACPLLEDFSYTEGGLPEGESHFTPGELLSVLRPLRGQLRHLAFEPDTNDNYLEWMDEDDMAGDGFWLDTLADFEVLETLVLPPEYLAVGREEQMADFVNSRRFLELLPPNIRSLELVTSGEAAITLGGNIELLEAVTTDLCFPHLRRFVLDVPVDRREDIYNKFRAAGIDYYPRLL